MERIAQIVERRIGHKNHTVKEEQQGQRAAEQIDDLARDAGRLKQIGNRRSEHKQQRRHQQGKQRGEPQPFDKSLAHPVHFARAVVLPDDRPDGP